jgi:HAE1 family hydrophobic/amphiphilic exporter-1
MKKIGASLILAVALTTFAQTNPPTGRPMSLQDCFVAALTNNFDVRVQQLNPQIAQLNLQSAYGGYDPTFTFGGTHSYDNQGAYVTQSGQIVGQTINNENNFYSGINGNTPWGMAYTLGGNGLNSPASVLQTHTHKVALGTNFFGDSSSGGVGINLSQPVLKNFWIDNNRLQIFVAKTQLKISEQGLRNQFITTVTAVENAYYELIYARENVQVQQEALTLAETQLHDDKLRVQYGSIAASGGTIEQDEAQVAQSQANLISALSTLGTDQRALKNLITDQYSKWFDADIQPTLALEAPRQLFDLQDSWSKGMTYRPDLQQAKLNLEQQGIQIKYYRNQLFPEVDLVGSYGFNGSGSEYNDSYSEIRDGSRPFYSYGGQITIPLSNTKARNQYKAGRATEKQLLLQLKQLEQNIMVEIDNAVGVARSDYESVGASRQARIYAEAALDAEEKKYAVGKSTTFTVLQLQNNLTTARSQEIRALANYNEALATLAQQEGTTLQRHNLELEVK